MLNGVYDSIFTMLDESNKVVFSDDERECLHSKWFGLFREGIVLQKSNPDIFLGHGLIQVTKILEKESDLRPFLCNLVEFVGRVPIRISFVKVLK